MGNPLRDPETYARAMLADCVTFRLLVDGGQAEALAAIHYDALPSPTDGEAHTLAEYTAYLPYALVFTSPEHGVRGKFMAASATRNYDTGGTVYLQITASIEDGQEDDVATVMGAWKDTIGDIIAELCALAGGAGYLDVVEWAVEELAISHPDDWMAQGPSTWATIRLDWGLA